MNDEGEKLVVAVNGLIVRLRDRGVAVRHFDCTAQEDETVIGRLVVNPEDDENQAAAEDEFYACYVCGRQVDWLSGLESPYRRRT